MSLFPGLNDGKNKNKTIFIIDDDVNYLKILSTFLIKDHDFNVYTYTNGYSAMEQIDIYKPEIIILDNDMPIISGLDIYKKFSDKLRNSKILVITSNSHAILSFKKLGVNNFLLKPFKIEAFLQMLDN